MPEDRINPPAKVTLEDLLRLKRCERPVPEFWTEFERALRQKQLAALVVRKPWWRSVAAIPRRLGFPLGAAALLGVAYLTVHRQTDRTAAPSAAPEVAPSQSLPIRLGPKPAAGVEAVAKPPIVSAPAPARVAGGRVQAAEAKHETLVAEEAPGTAARAVEPAVWLGEILAKEVKPAQLSPSARSIAVNYAAVTVDEPELVDSVNRTFGFADRSISGLRAQHAAEILPTAVAVTESRRTRMLASLDSTDSYAAERLTPDPARRSVLRSLSQEGWDHSMGRLEAEGDKLSIRF